MTTVSNPAEQTATAAGGARPGRWRLLEAPFERLFALRIKTRLAIRRARFRRAGLKPAPVRAMSEDERAAALSFLAED